MGICKGETQPAEGMVHWVRSLERGIDPVHWTEPTRACKGKIPAESVAVMGKPLPAHRARSFQRGIDPVHWTEPTGAYGGKIPAEGTAVMDKPLPAHQARSSQRGIDPVHWTEPTGACKSNIPAEGTAVINKPLPAHRARSFQRGIDPVHWTEPRGIENNVKLTEQQGDCTHWHALWTKQELVCIKGNKMRRKRPMLLSLAFAVDHAKAGGSEESKSQ